MHGAPNFRHRVTLKGMYRALICTFCLYVIVGVSGTASFGHDMAGNILLSYLPSNWLMTTVRLLYTFNMILSFVIVIYPVRAAILEWFHVSQNTPRGKRWFYVVGTIVPLAAVGLSIVVPNIVMVINIISSVFGFATYWLIPLVCIYICPRLKAKSLVPISDEVCDSNELDGQNTSVIPEKLPHEEREIRDISPKVSCSLEKTRPRRQSLAKMYFNSVVSAAGIQTEQRPRTFSLVVRNRISRSSWGSRTSFDEYMSAVRGSRAKSFVSFDGKIINSTAETTDIAKSG